MTSESPHVSKREHGLNPTRINELVARAQRAIDEGPLPSIQLAVAKEDQVVLDVTLGDADPGSRYASYSCIKPVVASLIWQLLDSGDLDIEQPVVDLLPEFGSNGKQDTTLRQLLCHTAGFPHAPMGPRHWWTSESRRRRMTEWRLNWEPDSCFEYHATSAHWVMVEMVQAVTGSDYRELLLERVIKPLQFADLRLGVPADEQRNINTVRAVGQTPSPEEVESALGVAMDLSELGHDVLLRYNEPDVLTLGVPGGGGVSTAADMAMFYQALLHNNAGLWSPEILASATSKAWVQLPEAGSGNPTNRGLGVVIKGDDEHSERRGMGSTCSPRSFGHNGVGGQVAWADPDSGISFCMLTNGLDADPLRSARLGRSLSNRAGALDQP